LKLSLFEYCLAANKEYLLAEWDTQRNVLSPERVSYGSQRRVWWTCEKGHQWEAMVKSRAGGTGCPYCSNRRIVAGENDLASAYPELAAEWDAEKNGVLSPTALPAGTTKKVWWRCGKGHTWCAAVSSRVRGAGCPVCTGKVIVAEENDLGSRFPEIAAQWHPTKNGSLTPKNCPPSSNRRVWWRCPLGHEYQAAVGARTVNGSDCPYCAGKKVLAGFNDLASQEPAVAAAWHPTLNGALTPQDVTTGSRRKVWWLCPEGHVWKAVVYSRARAQKTGCPVCAGRIPQARQARYSSLIGEKKTAAVRQDERGEP